MPELALLGAVGSLLSLTLSFFVFVQRRSKLRSKPYLILQQNLAQEGYFWSELSKKIIPLTETTRDSEEKQINLTFGILTLLSFFLSYLGIALQIIVWLSLEKLAVTSLKKN